MSGEVETNKVFLQGLINSKPKYSHTVKDEDFYTFDLKVARLSGQNDILPVTISKKLLELNNIEENKKIALRGQFRSFNKIEDDKRKLLLSVFVKEICEENDEPNANIIELDGYICKPVIYRTTPFSREICDVLLAVNRNFNKSDYIPCIAWGNNAQTLSKYGVPTKLKLVGRIQSREYVKYVGDEQIPTTKTAYEVSISKILLI